MFLNFHFDLMHMLVIVVMCSSQHILRLFVELVFNELMYNRWVTYVSTALDNK